MRRNWGVGILLLTALLASPAAASEQVFTNKPRFRIPFRFDAAEMQRLRPREIQLFVSMDHGLSWQHMQSANPNAGRFDFEATHDDEYWFAVKTLDAQNRLFPRENAEPGLKVVVDTTQPTLDVTLREVQRGRVQLAWNANDVHLDPTTLRLEYMQSGATDWQQVSVVPQASGQTTWSVPQGGFVAVRGSIHDLAGNVGQAEAQVNVGAGGGNDPETEEIEYREPVAGGRSPSDPFTPIPGFNSGVSETASPAGSMSRDLNAPAVSGNQTPSLGNNAGSAPLGKLISNSSANRSPGMAQQPAPSQQSLTPSEAGGILKQTVNSRTFQIGYRIDGATPSAISAIELYVTQDGGARWFLYGEDADRQSPFLVNVPADGEYGFEFRVRNANGPSSNPPKPGDRPSIVVTVDQTPPVAQLLPVQTGQGGTPNELLIQWQVQDAHLGSAPVAIACATDPAGPWRQISDWQPNTGRFFWIPEPGLPSQVYLRLTARDEAGNISEVATPVPVIVNAPQAGRRMMVIPPAATPGTPQ